MKRVGKSWAKGILALVLSAALFNLAVGQGTVEETAEERIERLKQELAAAQAQAKAEAEDAAGSGSGESEANVVDIPTGALVIVEGAEGGGGSGFIAELRDRLFFVTNIHVLAGARGAEIRTADGRSLALPDYAFLSLNRDIAILPIVWSGESLRVSLSLAFDGVNIGDAITVMGNSDGVGVATRLHGDIDGLGPDQLEISAKFVPGNSGSPIVHNKRGTVIGVVSHMRDLSQKTKWTEDSEQADIRRYGFRLDGEMAWERASLSQVFEEGERLARFDERTQLLTRTIYMLKNERTIMTGYRQHESLGYLFEPFRDGFNWKKGLASSNNVRKLQRLVNSLRSELARDRDSTADDLTLSFFKSRFLELDRVRDFYDEQLNMVSF
jgi:hypothetical protein